MVHICWNYLSSTVDILQTNGMDGTLSSTGFICPWKSLKTLDFFLVLENPGFFLVLVNSGILNLLLEN